MPSPSIHVKNVHNNESSQSKVVVGVANQGKPLKILIKCLIPSESWWTKAATGSYQRSNQTPGCLTEHCSVNNADLPRSVRKEAGGSRTSKRWFCDHYFWWWTSWLAMLLFLNFSLFSHTSLQMVPFVECWLYIFKRLRKSWVLSTSCFQPFVCFPVRRDSDPFKRWPAST